MATMDRLVKKIAFIGVIVFCAVLAWSMRPKKASCAWCYSGGCISSSICGSGCVCLKSGGDTFGSCYSINAK